MGRPRKVSPSSTNTTPEQAYHQLLSYTSHLSPQASHDWLESILSLISTQLDHLLDQGAVADSGEDDDWTDADLGELDDDGDSDEDEEEEEEDIDY